MFSFFRKYKRFKISSDILSVLPNGQKRDPITKILFSVGDFIVICRNCKSVINEITWKHLKCCPYCNHEKTTKELILVERNSITKQELDIELNQPLPKKVQTQENKERHYDEVLTLIIRILPNGEEYDIELPAYTTSKEIIEELIDANLLDRITERYILFNKANGKKVDYNQTIFDCDVNQGDTLIISPPLIAGYDINRIRNRISDVPNEVLKKGPAYVEEYLRRIEDNSIYNKPQPLNECKLIFIGSGEVGKTSLIKRLVEDRFNENEIKTDGIEITKWSISNGEKNIKLNIWDFGGQEIMHATHKFFMTRRSVYVLVINPRVQDQHSGEFELNYWLKLIGSFAGNSPVIIAINKCDIHKIDIGKGALIDRFPQIIGFVETSCKNNIGFENLKSLVSKAVGNLKHLNNIIPLNYLKVKENLEKTNKDYLYYYEYMNLCKEVDDKLSPEDLEILINLLNDLGVMLNVSKNRRLSETQVLNPEWITNGVYTIINSRNLIENKGVIDESQIKNILDNNLYPSPKERGFIMDMMSHFELSFQMPNRDFTYFIPGAFPKDKPASIIWDYDKYLHFQFHYDVFPISIISRFLVKMNSQIFENNYWRQGALIKKNNNIALIEAIPFEKKVMIKVAGNSDKRKLLTAIRKEFEAIHRSISKLKVESFLSLDMSGTYLANYNDLLSYEEEGIKTYFEPKKKKTYLVKELLNGIEERIELSNLKNDISKGRIKESLEELKNIFPTSNEIITLLARFNRIKAENISGILNQEVYHREENIIIFSILKIIDDFQREHGTKQSIKRQ